jgi:hypothetical protein
MTTRSIEQDNDFHLRRYKNRPPSASYIAGFIDGDGCIFIRKIKEGFQCGFSIAQSRTNVLQVIRYHFGGSITSTQKRNCNENKLVNTNNTNTDEYDKFCIRNQYNLNIRSNEFDILLKYLQDTFVIKNGQYECLSNIAPYINRPNHVETKQTSHEVCSKLNSGELKPIYNLSNINIEYIQGLFDAEGCIFISKNLKKYKLKLSQKSHPEVLNKICEFLEMGKVKDNYFVIYNKHDILKFINLVKHGLIVKYRQMEAFQKFLKTDDLFKKRQIYLICNAEKHQVEKFTTLNQHENGKEGFYNTLHFKKQKNLVIKELRKRQAYKAKSEAMKGANNHNYGKKKSKETRKKMSVSIRKAKNGTSDKTIREIRNLIKQGHKNVDIQKMLDVGRHVVTRVKNGKLVCRDETKINHKTTTQIERNIAKRKVTLDELYVIVDKIFENLKPSKVLQFINEQRSNAEQLGVDIVKNTKRNLLKSKLPFYKCEMDEHRFDDYQKKLISFLEANNK